MISRWLGPYVRLYNQRAFNTGRRVQFGLNHSQQRLFGSDTRDDDPCRI